ncbi:MAG: aminoacetone oxidase family FAD-binding enzyme [Bacillota bacterium]|nr:aminoacetone oxidase family FAD-binding enzyme [Bacillota bacterium]
MKGTNIRPLVIVGAGAAGLFLAALSAKLGHCPLLLERGPQVGRKLRLTGGGRGNLTHVGDSSELLPHYRPDPRFLWSLYAAWPPDRVRRALLDFGIPTHVEADGRVFPDSQSAAAVAERLGQIVTEHGGQILYGSCVSALEPDHNGWRLELEHGGSISAAKLVLATGGAGYPQTGSDGLGLDFLNKLGLPTRPFSPALVRLLWHERRTRQAAAGLAGLSLRDSGLALDRQNRTRGELLFTHTGLSGPCALNLSGRLDPNGSRLSLDLIPGEALAATISWLKAAASGAGERQLLTTLGERWPRRLLEALPVISPDWARFSRELPRRTRSLESSQIENLAALLHRLTLEPLHPAPLKEAMVSAGGLSPAALDPRSCAVRAIPGLHVIGELIDLDGDTGGYNLQFAFATAGAVADALAGQ